MRHEFKIILAALIFSISAHAQYPAAKPNANLREEVGDDQNRLIPVTEHFAAAIDGDAFFRNTGQEEYYHGFGYWLQARGEAKISDNFRMNMRSIFFAGSCSYGYAQPTGYYQLFAMSGELPDTILGGRLWVRVLDLDRQTTGAGLVIQEKEFNGMISRWTSGEHSLTLRIDGTGVFRVNDDTYNLEALLYDGLIGGGSILWPVGVEQDHLDHMRDPYFYLFSKKKFGWFSYAVEAGKRADGDAEMLMTGARQKLGSLESEIRLQARHYSRAFGRDFATRIQTQYVAYDQYNKDFTELSNIWLTSDDVNVYAAHLNLWWRLSDMWRLHSLNESGQFNFMNTGTNAYYYFRQGVEYCPGQQRDDCVNLFVSNKVLMNSTAIPPHMGVLTNDPTFKTLPFVGIEGRFHL